MIFKTIENLLHDAEKSKGPLKYQKAAIQAVDTFLRRPAGVTKRAPHMRDATDLKRFMLLVVISLLPCLLFGIYNTGRGAYLSIGVKDFSIFDAFFEGAIHVLPLVLISYGVGGFFEMVFAQIRKHEIAEGFLVTGILYPLICPATIPWWMFALGIIFGVVIGKEVFGGTGQNVMNPALTARAFLFFAYPAYMSGDVWVKTPYTTLADGTMTINSYTTIGKEKILAFISGAEQSVQGFSGASSLGIIAANKPGVDSLADFHNLYSFSDAFFGFIPGSIGETSTLLCLIGGLFLIITGVASYRTILGVFLGGIFMASIFYFTRSDNLIYLFHLTPLEHLVIGGFAFGAIFMATDPVSSPLLNKSRWIYGFFIGAICILIRVINPAYPEGMMLAILFMNIFSSLIDHYVLRNIQKKRLAYAQR